MSERILIVNADDFGRSVGVNRGVIRCHEQGIVTSASLMVRWPNAQEAAAYARSSSLGLGLHVDLGEWVQENGAWRARYEVLREGSAEEVAHQVREQLERFERLAGAPPDHLDSHQHVHRDEPARRVLIATGARLGIPVREADPAIAYNGHFYGQEGSGSSRWEAITADALVELIADLPTGTTELACHPATDDDHPSAYGPERVREVEALCDPRVRAEIDRRGVVLESFETASARLRSSSRPAAD